MKQTVRVEIAGQDLSIRSDEQPEYVQGLADYVDAHIRQLTGGKRNYSAQRVALLVAVQLADELFREKDLSAKYRRRVAHRLAEVERAVEEHQQLLESSPSTAQRASVPERDPASDRSLD